MKWVLLCVFVLLISGIPLSVDADDCVHVWVLKPVCVDTGDIFNVTVKAEGTFDYFIMNMSFDSSRTKYINGSIIPLFNPYCEIINKGNYIFAQGFTMNGFQGKEDIMNFHFEAINQGQSFFHVTRFECGINGHKIESVVENGTTIIAPLDNKYSQSINPFYDCYIQKEPTLVRDSVSPDIWFKFADGAITRRGFVEWDISSIPDTATITDVTLSYYSLGYEGTDSDQVGCHQSIRRPSVTDDTTLFTSYGTNFGYWYSVFFPASVGYHNLTTRYNHFNYNNIKSALQNSLNLDWFALSWTSFKSGYGMFESLEGSHSPMILTVNYTFILPTPVLISPENNEYIGDTTPLLEWNSVNGDNVHYIVQYGENLEYETDTTNTYFETQSFPYNSVIGYRVRAYENKEFGGWSSWSNTWYFTIVNQNPTVNLFSPINNTLFNDSCIVIMVWSEVTGNNIHYKIDINGQIYDTTSTNYSMFFDYRSIVNWRVKAVENSVPYRQTNWSETWSFFIDAEFHLIYPEDNYITHNNTIEYLWESVENAEYYEIQFFDTSPEDGYTSYVTDTNSFGFYCPWYSSCNWRVCAVENGNYIFSWSWNFTNIPPELIPPVLVSPINGSSVLSPVIFEWNDTGFDYVLSYSNNTGFENSTDVNLTTNSTSIVFPNSSIIWKVKTYSWFCGKNGLCKCEESNWSNIRMFTVLETSQNDTNETTPPDEPPQNDTNPPGNDTIPPENETNPPQNDTQPPQNETEPPEEPENPSPPSNPSSGHSNPPSYKPITPTVQPEPSMIENSSDYNTSTNNTEDDINSSSTESILVYNTTNDTINQDILPNVFYVASKKPEPVDTVTTLFVIVSMVSIITIIILWKKRKKK